MTMASLRLSLKRRQNGKPKVQYPSLLSVSKVRGWSTYRTYLLTVVIRSGAAITIWSAAPSRMTLPPGGVKVCLDAACEHVDVFQLYLNPPIPYQRLSSLSDASNASQDVASLVAHDPHHSPVPIWSISGLDYHRSHRVSVTLIEPNPDLGESHGQRRRALTLDHVSYVHVLGVEE